MQTLIISCSNSRELAQKIARHAKLQFNALIIKNFPDGELYVRYPIDVRNKKIILVQSMHPQPNEALTESLLAIHTAKKQGAKEVILIAPYLAYLRQDKQFHKGECVSNSIIAQLLSAADRIITIDPHLHRINRLSQIFTTKTTTLSAMQPIANYIQQHHINALLIGPDAESAQWASRVAQSTGLPFIVLHKKRYTARSVRTNITANVRRKNVIIIDDIISTGHTMLEPIQHLKKLGAKNITCIAVHGLFVENAMALIKKTGATALSTNTITTPASKIDISQLLANALR